MNTDLKRRGAEAQRSKVETSTRVSVSGLPAYWGWFTCPHCSKESYWRAHAIAGDAFYNFHCPFCQFIQSNYRELNGFWVGWERVTGAFDIHPTKQDKEVQRASWVVRERRNHLAVCRRWRKEREERIYFRTGWERSVMSMLWVMTRAQHALVFFRKLMAVRKRQLANRRRSNKPDPITDQFVVVSPFATSIKVTFPILIL